MNHKTLASPVLVVQIVNVALLMTLRFVHVSTTTLARHLIADLNVLSTRSVLQIKLAINSNVQIHVLEHVEVS